MTTKLSTKGQVILPKQVREQLGWRPGTDLVVETQADRVILRLALRAPETTLGELMGCTGYAGPAVSLEQMEDAIARGARARR